MAKKSAGGFDAQGQRIQNVGTPTAATDAASRAYVDALGVVKSNFAATTAPLASNDETQGYVIGSPWFIPGTGELWRARSVATGAARWVKSDTSDHPGYTVGNWYEPVDYPSPAGGGALVSGTIYLVPGVVKQRLTISQLGARVFTAGSNGNVQLGVYAHDVVLGRGRTLLGKTGSGSTATVARVPLPLDTNRTLEPGMHWFGLQADNTTVLFASVGGAATNYGAKIGSPNGVIGSTSNAQICGYSVPGTFGTWPADISGLATTELLTRVPAVEFLVASVP